MNIPTTFFLCGNSYVFRSRRIALGTHNRCLSSTGRPLMMKRDRDNELAMFPNPNSVEDNVWSPEVQPYTYRQTLGMEIEFFAR